MKKEKLIGLEYPERFFYFCVFSDKYHEPLASKHPYDVLDPAVWYCIEEINIYAERTIFRWFPPIIGVLYVFRRIDTPEEIACSSKET